jgi:hypothetical protein
VCSSHASCEKTPYLKQYEYNGWTIKVEAQDFSEFMKLVVQSMEKAELHTANENQKKMV